MLFRLFLLCISVVVLYIYLHNPLFSFIGGIGSIKLLYVLPIFLIFNKKTLKDFFAHYRMLLFSLLLIFLFTFIRTAFGGDITFVYLTIVTFIEVLLLPYCIVHLFFLRKNKEFDIFNLLFIIASIGSVISLLCFLFPTVNYFFRYVIQIFNERMIDNESRGFGLSDNLTFSYGMIQGLILAVWIIYMKKYKWFTFFVPFVLLSILINARTGIITPCICLMYYVLISRDVKVLFNTLIMLLFIYLIISSVDLAQINSGTAIWLDNFFNEVSALFSGNMQESSTFNTLTGEMFVLPESNSDWLIGRGFSLFLKTGMNTTGMNTDVGYLLQLNYGGLVYVSVLALFLFSLFRLQIKVIDKNLIVVFLLVCLIGNFKGDFILNSGGFRLVVIITMYFFELNCRNNKFLNYSKR